MFAEWSNKLFDEFIAGDKIAIISETTLKELENAPDSVKMKILEIPKEFNEYVEKNEEIELLAEKYLEHQAIPKKCAEDALHISLATYYSADVLVSWNFKHIVNYDRIKKYNAVNLLMGFNIIEIRSPKEMISNED
jgi:predicted nucleic acid-binding protein